MNDISHSTVVIREISVSECSGRYIGGWHLDVVSCFLIHGWLQSDGACGITGKKAVYICRRKTPQTRTQ